MQSHISIDNPIGIIGLDHIEFTANSLNTPTRDLFYSLGFEKTYENKVAQEELYSQAQVRFLLRANPDSGTHSRKYFTKHGEGVSKLSFLVENAEHAYKEMQHRGAEIIHPIEQVESEHGVYKYFYIKGFGDLVNEIIERPLNYFRPHFNKIEEDASARPLINRCARIDHLTNNVPKGQMDHWVEFYQRVFGFIQSRYFDIKGQKTGLYSKVVQLKNGAIIIPINEPEADNSKGQIQEFLDLHKGPGVQHIALTCGDIVATIGDLKERGIKFLDLPDTYYELLPKRNINFTESIKTLKDLSLLVDGDSDSYLLQIFTKPYIGPAFFEFIQRKKNNGFGEGNFQALFDSIELDQIRRGYI